MRKKLIISTSILFFLIAFLLLTSCQTHGKFGNGEYKINNINIYKGTPAWQLALAVRDEKTETIEKIIKSQSQLLNYQEPKYGATLLLWAVGMEKYKSAETLLKSGADPYIASKMGGRTSLFVAAGYSWVDSDAKKDPKYIKLLLSYGADPNKNYAGGDEHDQVTDPGTSPLMESIGSGIEKTKALVEGGADINYKTPTGRTAAVFALEAGGPNSTLEAMGYAHYLIVEKQAKVTAPYSLRGSNLVFYPVNDLRTWVYDLNSEKYKVKMDIVQEFSRQGVNYWDTKITSDELSQIKKLYPDSWEDYIKKY